MTLLAEIDSSIYYPITIPSIKKKTKFRPFRVREERALLTAQQTEDASVMLETLETIIRACVVDSPKNITVFDAEFLFVNIRAKSVGEYAEAVSTCVKCAEKNDISIDLTTVKIEKLDTDKKLTLSKNLVVLMKYPSLKDVDKVLINTKEQEMQAISASLDTVYFGDEVIHIEDSESADIIDFILNRTDEEMSKMVNFIHNIPHAIIESEYICKKCKGKNKVKIESISDFF